MSANAALEKLILPLVEALGLQWVGLQVLPQRGQTLLRVFVDKQGGVTVEDCEQLSRRINAMLSVEEDVMIQDYALEVSSPGMDRVLFTVAQCVEQIGKKVAVRLFAPMEGKRNFTGRLSGVKEDTLQLMLLDNDTEALQLSFTAIKEARLVPEW